MSHVLHCVFAGFGEALLIFMMLAVLYLVSYGVFRILAKLFDDDADAVFPTIAVMGFVVLGIGLTANCLHPEWFK